LYSFVFHASLPPPRSTLFPYTTLFRSYEPPDLVVPDVRHRYESGHMETHMRKEAAAALEELFAAAEKSGFDLMTISGYRSFDRQDRKSTRLNSSHVSISYAVFCLKKTT